MCLFNIALHALKTQSRQIWRSSSTFLCQTKGHHHQQTLAKIYLQVLHSVGNIHWINYSSG